MSSPNAYTTQIDLRQLKTGKANRPRTWHDEVDMFESEEGTKEIRLRPTEGTDLYNGNMLTPEGHSAEWK